MSSGLKTFVNEGAKINKILNYIGEPSTPPKISQTRGPPFWDISDAVQSEVFDAGPEWILDQQIGPDVQFDQSVNCKVG
jgi:hypothetical protein